MADHVHHWQIEPANGPTSVGCCACGEAREFSNNPEDAPVANLSRQSIPGGIHTRAVMDDWAMRMRDAMILATGRGGQRYE